jgi:ABC-2 type transport system ATP-binding protein
MDEAEHCDRLGMIYGGRLVALGSPRELKGAVGGAGVRGAGIASVSPTLEDVFVSLVERADRAAAGV